MFRHGFEKLKKVRNVEFDDEIDLGNTSTESVGQYCAASESETDCGSVSLSSFGSLSQGGSSRSFPSLSSIDSFSPGRNKVHQIFTEEESYKEQDSWYVGEKSINSSLDSNQLSGIKEGVHE